MKTIKIALFSLSLLLSNTIFAANDTENNIPLPADAAFSLTTSNNSKHQIVAQWKIADGYYLYKDRFQFQLKPETVGRLAKINLPQGIQKQDDILGKYQVYKHELNITIPVPRQLSVNSSVIIKYQGCASSGFCYPPMTRTIPFEATQIGAKPAATLITSTTNTLNASSSNNVAQQSDSATKIISEQDRATRLLASNNYLWILLSFFGFGLLLSFTPCVLPMIPILSGIIAGQSKGLNTRKAFKLSLAYVLTMASTYAGAGILAGYAGSHLQATLQNPWALSIFCIIFIVLALSMFGFFDLRLPHRVHNHIMNLHSRQQGGNYLSVVIMGILSTLIVSPCVSAPLVGALSYIGDTGNAFLGGVALFTLGLGMGVPLLVIGTTEGTFLPKSGQWMHAIKVLFGILLLGVSIWIIARVIPSLVTMLLWAALFIGTGIYLRQFKTNSVNISRVIVNLSFLTLLYGAVILLGAALGNRDPLRPLHFASQAELGIQNQSLNYISIKSLSDLKSELVKANKQHRYVMVDFYADWCIACKEMERNTFSNPKVKDALRNTIILKADITAYDADDVLLTQQLRVLAPPTFIFFTPEGNELISSRIVGNVGPDKFLKILNTNVFGP